MDLISKRCVLDKKYIEDVVKTINIGVCDRILDIGCGNGVATKIIAQLCPDTKVIGADISKEAITVAQEFYSLPNIQFEVADATNLPYSNDYFDCCIARMLIDVSPNINSIIEECSRVVRAQGCIVFYGNTRTTGLGNCVPKNAFKLIEAYERYRKITRYIGFDVSYIRRYLEKKGFLVYVKYITKDTIEPGRRALLEYYSAWQDIETFSKENVLVKLHLLQPQDVIEYESDLKKLLEEEKTYISFEQAAIIAYKK